MPEQYVLAPSHPGPAPVTVNGGDVVYEVPILNGGTVSSAGTITVPDTIAAGATFTSTVIPTAGMGHVVAVATMDQAGTLELQRYADRAGVVPTGTLVATAMTKNTQVVVDNSSTLLTQSLKISIVNAATVDATPSGVFVAVAP